MDKSGKGDSTIACSGRVVHGALVASMLALLVGARANAADQGVTGKKLLINGPGRKIVVISKDPSISITGSDPVTGADSSISINGSEITFALPKSLWSKNGAGTVFKYKNPAAPSGPSSIKIVKLKSGSLKFIEQGATLSAPSGMATIDITLNLDGLNNRYCMSFTGTGDGKKFLVKDAPAGTCAAPQKLSFTVVPGTTNCGPAGLTSPPTAPFSGEIDSDTAGTTKLSDLGLGCLYLGGGSASVIAGRSVPDGGTTTFAVSGASLVPDAGTGRTDCTLAAGPGKHCVNNDAMPACSGDGDCGGLAGTCALDANCYLGPPLPIVSPVPFGALTTCVVNTIQAGGGGTVDVATGNASASLSLSSRVYITGRPTSPCPKCLSGVCDTSWTNALSQHSPDSGDSCTAVGTLQTSLDCRPAQSGFNGALAINVSPLTTGTATMSNATGAFCPSQNNNGAFGQPGAQRISETGLAPGDLSDNAPHFAQLGAVFCIPGTGNGALDGVADLPGPGAVGVNGIMQLNP